jgi:hypothetical protein
MNKTIKELIENAHYAGQRHSETYHVTRESAKRYANRIEKDFNEIAKED